jgi:hypothetical protein
MKNETNMTELRYSLTDGRLKANRLALALDHLYAAEEQLGIIGIAYHITLCDLIERTEDEHMQASMAVQADEKRIQEMLEAYCND